MVGILNRGAAAAKFGAPRANPGEPDAGLWSGGEREERLFVARGRGRHFEHDDIETLGARGRHRDLPLVRRGGGIVGQGDARRVLAGNSGEVLEAFLTLTGHDGVLAAKKLIDVRDKIAEMLELINSLTAEAADQATPGK